MQDLLQAGQAWLADQLHEHVATEVMYRRGTDEVTVRATIGRTLLNLDDGYGGVRMVWTDRDFLIRAADLVLGGSPAQPQRGDQIREVVGADTLVYEVLANAWTNFIGLLKKGWNHFAGFFQKVWARIKGLFTETNADEEIARINAEVAQQDEAINAQRDAKLAEREQARQKERERIERDRVGAQGALDDMQAEEQRRREAKHQAALKESEDELAKARREWQAALQDAADKRAEAEANAPERLKRPTAELPTTADLDALVKDTRRKIDVVGSFNPLAACGLGADSLSERTVKATEQVAANTKQLVREAQHGGLVFA